MVTDDADREAFDLVTTGFYRGGEPELVGRALRHWLGFLAAAPTKRRSVD